MESGHQGPEEEFKQFKLSWENSIGNAKIPVLINYGASDEKPGSLGDDFDFNVDEEPVFLPETKSKDPQVLGTYVR
jgi:hypothetical protein